MHEAERLSAALFVLLVGGCSSLDNCPEAQADIVVTGGTSRPEERSFESNPADGPLQLYPAKTRLRVEHELGFTPRDVLVYVSFDPNGTAGDGSMTLASGNTALFDCVDSHTIIVRNDTCESFYARVTAGEVGADPKYPCDTE